jgi:hypothetical protein
VYSTHKIKAAAATLMVGFLLAIAFAGAAQAGVGKAQGMTAQVRKAERLRGDAMNRFYHLGAYSPQAEARRAEERRSEAANQYYRLGRYAVVRVSSKFDWADAGIGAGATLGALILAGGLTVGVRRRTAGKGSFPTTA